MRQECSLLCCGHVFCCVGLTRFLFAVGAKALCFLHCGSQVRLFAAEAWRVFFFLGRLFCCLAWRPDASLLRRPSACLVLAVEGWHVSDLCCGSFFAMDGHAGRASLIVDAEWRAIFCSGEVGSVTCCSSLCGLRNRGGSGGGGGRLGARPPQLNESSLAVSVGFRDVVIGWETSPYSAPLVHRHLAHSSSWYSPDGFSRRAATCTQGPKHKDDIVPNVCLGCLLFIRQTKVASWQ